MGKNIISIIFAVGSLCPFFCGVAPPIKPNFSALVWLVRVYIAQVEPTEKPKPQKLLHRKHKVKQ